MMRNWLFSGLFLAVALIGCGGGGGNTRAVTADDFCDDKAAAECADVAGRCGNNMVNCVTARKAVCLQFVEGAMSPTRKFKVANMATCLSQTKNVYKNVLITPAQQATMDDACSYVFQGDAAKLEPCETKYDCKTGLICDKGLCATKIAKNKDDLCSDPGAICNAGSICSKDADSGVFKCVAKGGAGEACDNDTNPCLEALRCSAGMCVARAMSGEACMSNDDCATTVPFCDDSIGNKCDQGLNLGPGSAACAKFGGA